MHKFLINEDKNDGPLLLFDLNTMDRIVADNPRELVGAFLRFDNYEDIQDGGVARFVRDDYKEDTETFRELQDNPLPYPIDTASDRKFLMSLIKNELVVLYENSGSYRVRSDEKLPPIEHRCVNCVYALANEKCAQFEIIADDDGETCMGFARPDLPADELDTNGEPALIKVV